MSVLNLSGQFSFFLGRQLTRSGQLSLFLVRVHDLLGSRSRVRSAVEVTSTSATGRSASKRSATASICCGFARPRSALRRVRAVPGALAARCTPSRQQSDPASLHGSTLRWVVSGCQLASRLSLRICLSKARAGTMRRSVLTRPAVGAGGVPQFRLRVGRCRDDHLGDGGGIVAVLDRRRHHVVEDRAAAARRPAEGCRAARTFASNPVLV